MSELNGSIAVISGGLGDIGRAIALELARRGADVAVCDLHDEGRADLLAREIEAFGRRFRCDLLDVSEADAVCEWIRLVEEDLGLPDLIIPNAGITLLRPLLELKPHELDHLLKVNLFGAFHLAQAGARRLVEKKRTGRIVFTGSWAAHAPHSSVPAYCVTKAALRMFGRCLALELAPHGILVNEVAPGWVDAGVARDHWRQDPTLRERSNKLIPIGEHVETLEVAVHVANLCDPRLRATTGGYLLCDGAMSQVNPTWSGFHGIDN